MQHTRGKSLFGLQKYVPLFRNKSRSAYRSSRLNEYFEINKQSSPKKCSYDLSRPGTSQNRRKVTVTQNKLPEISSGSNLSTQDSCHAEYQTDFEKEVLSSYSNIITENKYVKRTTKIVNAPLFILKDRVKKIHMRNNSVLADNNRLGRSDTIFLKEEPSVFLRRTNVLDKKYSSPFSISKAKINCRGNCRMRYNDGHL